MENINVLYADDDVNNLETFYADFKHYYKVFTASSIDDTKRILAAGEIQVLITSQKMQGTIWAQSLEEAIKINPPRTRIVFAVNQENETIPETFQRGLVFKYLLKPYAPEVLKRIIDSSYEIYTLKQMKEQLSAEVTKTQDELKMLRDEMKEITDLNHVFVAKSNFRAFVFNFLKIYLKAGKLFYGFFL